MSVCNVVCVCVCARYTLLFHTFHRLLYMCNPVCGAMPNKQNISEPLSLNPPPTALSFSLSWLLIFFAHDAAFPPAHTSSHLCLFESSPPLFTHVCSLFTLVSSIPCTRELTCLLFHAPVHTGCVCTTRSARKTLSGQAGSGRLS